MFKHHASGITCLAIFIFATACSTHITRSLPEEIHVALVGEHEVVSLPSGKRLAAGHHVTYVAVSPDGRTVIANSPNKEPNSVFVSSTDSDVASMEIFVNRQPKGVKITPDGRHAYVCNEGSANISVIDLASRQVIETISTGPQPHNLRFDSTGKLGYVTLQGGDGLGVINLQTNEIVDVIPIPGFIPHNLDLSSDGKTAFIRDHGHGQSHKNGKVAVVDLESRRVLKVIPVGAGHSGIDVSPDDRYVFTGGHLGGYVYVIDPVELEVVRRIPVGKHNHGLRTSSDGRWLYVTNAQLGVVTVIDTADLTIEKEIFAGSKPIWIAVQGNP